MSAERLCCRIGVQNDSMLPSPARRSAKKRLRHSKTTSHASSGVRYETIRPSPVARRSGAGRCTRLAALGFSRGSPNPHQAVAGMEGLGLASGGPGFTQPEIDYGLPARVAGLDDFQRSHPCPCAGRTTGVCPRYLIDHVNPLKLGGADSSSNMQWQTTAAAKAKDRTE